MQRQGPERSSGAIIVNCYTPQRFKGSEHPKTKATKPRRDYLVLHYEAGHWDFPKGHVEGEETEEEAAIREIEEETGLVIDKFKPNFKKITEFWFWAYPKEPGGKSKRTKKTVTFFLAETSDREIKLSWEHTGYAWLPYKDALDIVTHDNAKNLLKQAEKTFRDEERGSGAKGQSPRRRRGNRRRGRGQHRNNQN